MLIDNEFISDDTMNFQDFHNFEFSPILDESAEKNVHLLHPIVEVFYL